MAARFILKNPLEHVQLGVIVPVFIVAQAAIQLLNGLDLIPNILTTISLCNLVPFTPRDILYPSTFFAALEALFGVPFTPPATPSFGSLLSRLLQAFILYHVLRPTSKSSPFTRLTSIGSAWVPVALMRTLIAYIFTRSVGWAYPSLFRHWALYETSEGLGAGLVAWVYLRVLSGGNERVKATTTANRFKVAFDDLLHLHERPTQNGLLVIGSLVIFLASLEGKPWTYGCALLSAGLLHLIISFIPANNYERLPLPLSQNRPAPKFLSHTFLPALRSTFIPLVIIFLSSSILNYIVPEGIAGITPIPPPPRPAETEKNLLEIILLTYPRPGDTTLAEKLITTTIDSFKPLLEPSTGRGQVALTVFTNAPQHIAFKRAKAKLKEEPGVQFFLNDATLPEDEYYSGQHLHLAEAFKWISSDRPDRKWKPAEWVMIIEDDFPLCDNGEDLLMRTMWLLEMTRKQSLADSDAGEWQARAGFIGTGGSGLIFHQSTLPMVESNLRNHARYNPFPLIPTPRRPADVVMQDCLMGKDPLCARQVDPPLRSLRVSADTPVSVERDLANIRRQNDLDVMIFAPSRLVMDHIGGLVSTTKGKAGNTDKWRCGWRHAFHGERSVGVFVVS